MKNLINISFILFSIIMFGQQNKIIVSGNIIDQDTNIPLEYATVSIYKSGDSIIKYGGVSDSIGKFEIEVSKGLYDFKIEYISFNEKLINEITVSKNTSLGMIKMSINENLLDEVEVVGEKTEVEIKLDKTVYNIGKDLSLIHIS